MKKEKPFFVQNVNFSCRKSFEKLFLRERPGSGYCSGYWAPAAATPISGAIANCGAVTVTAFAANVSQGVRGNIICLTPRSVQLAR
jgi:hypothetical protein